MAQEDPVHLARGPRGRWLARHRTADRDGFRPVHYARNELDTHQL